MQPADRAMQQLGATAHSGRIPDTPKGKGTVGKKQKNIIYILLLIFLFKMTNTIFLRKGMAIAICLAVTTFGAQAQLGGMLKKAADSAKKEATKTAEKKAEKMAEDAVSKATEKATEKVTQATESVVQSVVPNP